MGCPLALKSAIQDFKENPRWLKAWLRAGKKYWDNKPDTGCHRKYNDIYEVMYMNLFCDSYADYYHKFREGCLFESEQKTAKQMLEEIFKIEL